LSFNCFYLVSSIYITYFKKNVVNNIQRRTRISLIIIGQYVDACWQNLTAVPFCLWCCREQVITISYKLARNKIYYNY